MRRVNVVGLFGNCILLAMVLLTGCSGPSPKGEDHSRDAERYAVNVKNLVLMAVEDAGRSREPGDELRPVILELEQKDRPRGPYEATYQELASKLREIHQACEANDGSPPPNLRAQLEELKQLAAKLPGEVAVVPRSTQD